MPLDSRKMILAAAKHCWAAYKDSGGTQESFAAQSGLGRSTISQMLSGEKTGRWPQVDKLAEAFGYDLADFMSIGKRLLTKKGEVEAVQPRLPMLTQGMCQVKLPAWDQRELSKLERDHLEMALAVLRSKQVDGGGYALALRQNIKQFYKPVIAEIAALEDETGAVPRGPAVKAKKRAVGGA